MVHRYQNKSVCIWHAYNNDALRAYLNGAQRNGLGVIVRCDYLELLLNASDLEGKYNGWQGVMDHYVNYLSKWSSFKGFMMSDELGTTYASNYVAVAGYLHEKYGMKSKYNLTMQRIFSIIVLEEKSKRRWMRTENSVCVWAQVRESS